MKKKSRGEGSAGVRSGVGSWSGVARLGVVGDVGYRGCKPRIESIDKCKYKRYCTILRIIKIMIIRGTVGAGGLDLTQNHLKLKKKTKIKKKQK